MNRAIPRSTLALALSGALLAALLAVAVPLPAWAASSVTVEGPDGTSTVDPDYATEVTVRGSGFQSIKKGFGGVYVLFGWVDGSWRPSQGGVVGADYRYVPDSESRDNAGFQRFVAFPGSETEAAAHAVMSDDGSWSVSMTIPGARFESRDRSGDVSGVDCLKVTCGVITIGAHGVKNANNETFTPVSFASGGGSAPAAAGGTLPDAAPGLAAPGEVRLGLASARVDAGTSIAFTGQGFAPGEQVVATLDRGLVSVGPLSAGAQGEVAGVMSVPRDVRGGTHLVTLTGAASGAVAESPVEIVAGASPLVAAAAAETPMWLFVLLVSCIGIALVLIVTSVVVSIRRSLAARRARAQAASAAASASSAPPPPAAPTAVIPAPREAGPDAVTERLAVGAGEHA
ncbi:hypothetical protein [Microbacterium ulmi]|uniref:Uncharacterized protein n=1 Tax=Microbacterium ulmi TaxID=179095 RepID=A0A7Y2LZ57_9MICO|nr:hypothetical protein [Microbacterium ulmi]NII69618.1 hypothetical protein [Microbacterium ulmi]NNH03494.1 hypothetical protein [Microbacterium ulmi]